MTADEKKQISELRASGYGYRRIAQAVGLSENTVKSFCKRHCPEPAADAPGNMESVSTCEACGRQLIQAPHRKKKRFCSDRCRMEWWNAHLDQVKRKANYEFTCPVCKKAFTVYGNANRKYCSLDCYFDDRFGGRR